RERAGGRRLGDRGDHRPSHPLRQDGCDRRPGPLRAARSSQGQIQGVGARLRSRRFAQVDGEAGQQLNLRAVQAPNEAAAAQYDPAIYWYSMLKIPDKSEFGGKSNIPEKLTQIDWLKQTKNIGCIGCHQLGQQATRTIPAAFGEFKSGEEAWMRRIQSGQ